MRSIIRGGCAATTFAFSHGRVGGADAMDVDIELALVDGLTATRFVEPLAAYGDIVLLTRDRLTFDWKTDRTTRRVHRHDRGVALLVVALRRVRRRAERRHRSVGRPTPRGRVRVVFRRGTVPLVGPGLNRTTAGLADASPAWFAACAVFRHPTIEVPAGFVDVDGAAIAVHALRRLTVVDAARPPTAEQRAVVEGIPRSLRAERRRRTRDA